MLAALPYHSRCNCRHEWWWRRSEQVLLKLRVTIVESLIVIRGPCVARVAYSNSGQPKPQPTTTTKPQGRGGDVRGKGTTTGPHRTGGAGQGAMGWEGEGVCGSPVSCSACLGPRVLWLWPWLWPLLNHLAGTRKPFFWNCCHFSVSHN